LLRVSSSASDSGRLQVGERVKIYRRGHKKIWNADFWWRGEHHRKSLKTRNEKEARRRAVQLEAELSGGEYRPRQQATTETLGSTTFAEARDEFLAFKAGKIGDKTNGKYTHALDELQAYCGGLGITRIAELTLRVFDKYRAKRTSGSAEKTAHNDFVTLKQFFRWCFERKMIRDEELVKQRFPKPKSKKPKPPPTLDQVNLVLRQFSGERLVALGILAFTGMRAGECQRLRQDLGDVDLEGGWIHIKSVEGEYKTKTGDSWKVPIHPRLRNLLETVPKGKRKWFLTAPRSRQYPNGDHWLNMKHLTEAFEEAIRKIGLSAGRKNDGFVLHSLRAFFKTFCVNRGIPREIVDAWQNHKGGRETASDRYYSLSDEESQEQMKKVPFGDG
jgi:integrase